MQQVLPETAQLGPGRTPCAKWTQVCVSVEVTVRGRVWDYSDAGEDQGQSQGWNTWPDLAMPSSASIANDGRHSTRCARVASTNAATMSAFDLRFYRLSVKKMGSITPPCQTLASASAPIRPHQATDIHPFAASRNRLGFGGVAPDRIGSAHFEPGG